MTPESRRHCYFWPPIASYSWCRLKRSWHVEPCRKTPESLNVPWTTRWWSGTSIGGAWNHKHTSRLPTRSLLMDSPVSKMVYMANIQDKIWEMSIFWSLKKVLKYIKPWKTRLETFVARDALTPASKNSAKYPNENSKSNQNPGLKFSSNSFE